MTDLEPFDQLERRTPRHDPLTCTRVPCRRCLPSPGPASPAIKANPHEAQAPPPPPDRPVASIGLPKHPDPSTIADTLEAAAKAIRTSGLRAIDLAGVLASRGYAASTLGDGGSRGTDSTSSTERAGSRAIGETDPVTRKPNPLPSDVKWHGADRHYAGLLRQTWKLCLDLRANTDELLRHADDVDPTPAGTGECRACATFIRPNKEHPDDRLRSGLCPTCYRAWRRYVDGGGTQLWSDWCSRRREGLTERNDSDQVVKIHPPADGDNPSTPPDLHHP